MTVSSVLIVIVVVFFITKLFTANPMEGTWISDEGDVVMEIRDDGTLSLGKNAEKAGFTATTDYTVDKKTKVFTVHVNENEITEQAEQLDGSVTEDMIREMLESMEGTYDYSIDRNTLTLTEREYGSQMTFERE